MRQKEATAAGMRREDETAAVMRQRAATTAGMRRDDVTAAGIRPGVVFTFP